MTVDPIPECLTGVADLSQASWAALLAAVRRVGDDLVNRQPVLASDPAALAALELAVEDALIAALRECLGDVSVLAEEHFNRTGQVIDGSRPMRILLDPLDGSRSYAAGSSRYSIAIAGVVADEPLFAVVHQPALRRTYTAVSGRGAYLGADPIVAKASAPRTVAIRRSAEVPDAVHRVADRLTGAGYTLERLESTALKLCWIGAGEYGGLVKPVTVRHDVLCTWALTPGLLVARELGVVGHDLDGAPWRGREGVIAVGDPHFLDDIGAGP